MQDPALADSIRCVADNIIYALLNDRSGRLYIGKSSCGLDRPRRHAYNAKRNLPYPVYHWINKYNGEYDIVVLEECRHQNDLDEAEQFYIAYFRSLGFKLLNMTDGGGGTAGYQHSAELRQYYSATRKGRRVSMEARLKISKALKGRLTSAEHRAKLSKANKGKVPAPHVLAASIRHNTGRKLSEETSAKMRASQAKRPPHTPEQCAKISAAKMGHKVTAETRLKLSVANTNPPAERRAKMSAAKFGKKLPEDHRKNLQRANRARSETLRQTIGLRPEKLVKSPEKLALAHRVRALYDDGKTLDQIAKMIGKSKSQTRRLVMSSRFITDGRP